MFSGSDLGVFEKYHDAGTHAFSCDVGVGKGWEREDE